MSEVEKLMWYIESEMDFYSYPDFLDQAELLKKMYVTADVRTKKLYHWYVYSRDIKYGQKNRIWEFLNGDIDLEMLLEYERENKIRYNRRK